MHDIYIPDEGCEIITINWLNYLEVLVVFTEDAFLELVEINELQETLPTSCWYNNNGITVRLVKGDTIKFLMAFNTIDVRVILHECVHTVDYIFDDKGIPISMDNTETRAYMVDYLFSLVCKVLNVELPEPMSNSIHYDEDLGEEVNDFTE